VEERRSRPGGLLRVGLLYACAALLHAPSPASYAPSSQAPASFSLLPTPSPVRPTTGSTSGLCSVKVLTSSQAATRYSPLRRRT
jgi:hypothetical protein